MTFATRTDPNGIFTCSFPEPGWWCLAAQRDARRREYEGTEYPVRERVILWVFVGAS
jgi:hypothetical protein